MFFMTAQILELLELCVFILSVVFICVHSSFESFGLKAETRFECPFALQLQSLPIMTGASMPIQNRVKCLNYAESN